MQHQLSGANGSDKNIQRELRVAGLLLGLILILGAALLAGCESAGTGGGKDQSNGGDQFIDWSPYYAQDVAWTSSDWGEPELVTASTSGWEEGVYISGDGDTLYYIYTNVDVFRDVFSGERVVSGPLLDTEGKATRWVDGNSRNAGEYPYADHFYVTRTGDNEWSDPEPHFLTTTRMESIGGIHIIENEVEDRRMAYVMSGFNDGVDSLYYAFDQGRDGWESFPVVIPDAFTFQSSLVSLANIPADSEHEDADPWVNDAGTILFFWSDRDGTDKDIFYSTNMGRGIVTDDWDEPQWTAPVKLPAPINTAGDDMQTFVFNEDDGDYLYYSTNRGADSMGYEIAIYRSKMPDDWEGTPANLVTGTWGEPERVIYSDLAVGEPSLTDDGEFLYFEQIYTDGNDNFNPEIMRVRRKP